MDFWLDISNNLLIDSGAFSFITGAIKMNKSEVLEYFDKYLNFVEQYTSNPIITGFFELDIDRTIGYSNVKLLRKRLFDVSDKIIPVYHKSLGLNEFKELCKNYDYISIPNKDTKPEELPYYVKYAHKYDCKIHGLGITKSRVLNNVPFDSVDSMSWFTTGRYARYKGKRVNSEFVRKKYKEFTFYEFYESILKQRKYYEKWKDYHND